ncbi:YkgJ family cysteine cluster protein [Bacillus pseudomycoides]|uniref:YkgJ family cysteine cluster protein n=1 Tax=Bacillus pseudomycoides TaxID=64104 RepID=UPI000BEF2AC8|nr:SEC-C metal-binding domain-containing protein [Bacillus pseudomycoides]PEI52373.1 preprotein translocase subunit SecA [Bacillus pseudomycoides]PHE92006.1 preprotein translocase subunit SecA [Bacillus pseudomycoides]
MYESPNWDSLLIKAFQDTYEDIIEIKRNDPCPCGSGLKFKNCHIESDDKWGNGFKFYDGNFSYENASLTLELLNTIREILLQLKSRNSINEEFGIELLEKLYSAYDPAIEQLQKKAPCKKGCTACCFQQVSLQKIEAQRINIHINKKIKKVIKYNLKETKARKKVPSSLWTNRQSSIEPCPFLDITKGECSIYSIRPMHCRSHFVLSNPNMCNDITGNVTWYAEDRYIKLPHTIIALINQLVYGDTQPTLLRSFYKEISLKKQLNHFLKGLM